MGTLPTWEQALASLIEPLDWQFKGQLHELPQPKAAEPDLWDHATSFQAHPGMPKCDSPGMLNGFGRLTKVMIYPTCTNSLWSVVVLAFPVPGEIDMQGGKLPGWLASNQSTLTQDTWGNLEYCTVKQIKNTFMYGYNPTPWEAPW